MCFPTACATACSFDRELLETLGETLGDECQAENLSVILGPAVNIKRSPLCGRNFEYFSEDPYLASQMAAAHIKVCSRKMWEHPSNILRQIIRSTEECHVPLK